MKTILVFGMLVASAFPAVQAQEDHITIYKDAKGIVYYNEVFFINEENSPVRINNVMLRHIPQETAVLAEAYRSSLFRYLEDHEKDRLRRLAKETLTITICQRRKNCCRGVVVTMPLGSISGATDGRKGQCKKKYG